MEFVVHALEEKLAREVRQNRWRARADWAELTVAPPTIPSWRVRTAPPETPSGAASAF